MGRDLDIQAIEHRLLTTPAATSCWSRAWPGPGSPRCWRTWPGGGSAPAWSSRCSGSATRTGPGPPARSSATSAPSCSRPAEHAHADTHARGRPRSSRSPSCCAPTRHLLILDNAESITAAPAAIPHALDPGRAAQIRTSWPGCAAAGPWSCSAPANRDLAHPGQLGDEIYPLPGLDPQAASLLVDRILRRHGATRWLTDDRRTAAPCRNWSSLLGGYPLPLTVVLPVLAARRAVRGAGRAEGGRPGRGPGRADHPRHRIQPRQTRPRPAGLPAAARPVHRRHPAPADSWTPTRTCCSQDETVQGLGQVDLAAAARRGRHGSASPPRTPSSATWSRSSRCCPTSCAAASTSQPACRPPPARPTTSSTRELARRPARDAHLTPADPQQRATGQAADPRRIRQPDHRPRSRARNRPAHRSLIARCTSTWIRPSSTTPAASSSTTPSARLPAARQPTARDVNSPSCTTSPEHRPRPAPPRRRQGPLRSRAPAASKPPATEGPGHYLPSARLGRPGAAAVRGGRSQLPQSPRHLPGVRRPARAPPAPTISSARSPRSSGGSTRPKPTTAKPSTSSWSSATGTPRPAPTISSAPSPRSSGSSRRPRPTTAKPSTSTWSSATGTAPPAPTIARHGRPGAASGSRRPKPTTAKPSTSSWSSATGTARPAPTISSASLPRSRGGSRRPRPTTAKPSTSTWSSATGTRGEHLPPARHRRPGAAAVRGSRSQLPQSPRHLPGVRRPALRGEHLPSARQGRPGAGAVRGSRSQLPQSPRPLPGVRRPALRGEHLPSARHRRPGAEPVRGSRSQLPQSPRHLPGVRRPALRCWHLPSARRSRPRAEPVRGGRGRVQAGHCPVLGV